MSKKLKRNGLWESSRMMLPQHKETSIRRQRELQRIPRSVKDEQEIQNINAALLQSQVLQKNVHLTIYNEYKHRNVTGIVKVSQRGSFRLNTVDPFNGEEDWEWINYQDVLKAELNEEWIGDEMIDL